MHNVSLKHSSVKLVQLWLWMGGLNGIDLVRNEHLLILLVSCQLSTAFNKYGGSTVLFLDMLLENAVISINCQTLSQE